jgi:hypothetical protein
MKGPNIFIALLLAGSLLGCVTTGTAIRTERVQAIIPGETTKSDLLDMFGAPASVSARDETVTLPSTAIMGSPFSNRFSYRLRADTFFTLFAPADEYHRVYYFFHAVSYTYPVWYVVYFGENGKTKTDRLWVLVDERTGTVEDYAFKRYGEDTVFGRAP